MSAKQKPLPWRARTSAWFSARPRIFWWFVAPLLFVGAMAVVIGFNRLFPVVPRYIWWVQTLDAAVIVTLAAIAGIAIKTLALPAGKRERFLTSTGSILTASILLLSTLFVTYASFRNQTRLTAEQLLNDDGSHILDVEFAHPELRCIYLSYGHEDPNGCLERIAGDRASWSLAMFYVEESLSLLMKAERDRREWGSTYAASVRYWQDDIGRDAAGLFSYYLVSAHAGDGLPGAVRAMNEAGVSIPNLCANYRKVWLALARHSAQPAQRPRCA